MSASQIKKAIEVENQTKRRKKKNNENTRTTRKRRPSIGTLGQILSYLPGKSSEGINSNPSPPPPKARLQIMVFRISAGSNTGIPRDLVVLTHRGMINLKSA